MLEWRLWAVDWGDTSGIVSFFVDHYGASHTLLPGTLIINRIPILAVHLAQSFTYLAHLGAKIRAHKLGRLDCRRVILRCSFWVVTRLLNHWIWNLMVDQARVHLEDFFQWDHVTWVIILRRYLCRQVRCNTRLLIILLVLVGSLILLFWPLLILWRSLHVSVGLIQNLSYAIILLIAFIESLKV